MPSEHMKTVIDFCLDHAPSAPAPRRAKLYRGLAEFCGDMQQAALFTAAARDIEAAETSTRELELALRQP